MDEQRLNYAERKVDYMIQEGIISTYFEKPENKGLFNRLNQRAMSQGSAIHGLLYGYAIGVVMLMLQWTAQLFHAILHHKHGRRYMHPVRFLVSALFSFLVLGSLAGVVGSMIVGAVGMLAIMPIYIIGFVLVCIWFYIATTTFKDEPRHTMSVGVPWIYTRTGNEFFLTTRYIYIIQPIAVFVASFLLLQIIPVIGALLLMASIFFAIYSFAAASQIHDYHLDGIDARIEAEFRGAEDVLFQADVDQIKQQQVEAGDANDILGVEGQPELVKPKGAKSYL